jgi:hypothetical protein
MMRHFVIGAVYLAAQLIMTAPALQAAAQKKETQASTNKPAASKGTTANQSAQRMSELATRLLQHVDQARHAISSNNKQAALNHINQAWADRNQLATLAKSKGGSLVIPLYTEFDATSTLGPMMAARKGKHAPGSTNGSNTYAPVTVEQASGEFTFVGLDLDKAKTRLDSAKTALNNGNNQAASDSLSAIETDLIMETDEASLPLLAARENLGIAEAASKDAHPKEAAAALKEASTDLDKFAASNPPQHADEARNLSKAIDSYAQNIGSSHTAATAKIDAWWREVDSWFKQNS